MNITVNRLNHVQLCIPKGAEEKARNFYTGILQLREIPKPESLRVNGGLWYEIGDIELHIGVEEMKGEKSKRHPAFEVEKVEEVKQYLLSKNIKVKEEIAIPDVVRFSFFDPFGNRIEFLEKLAFAKSLGE